MSVFSVGMPVMTVAIGAARKYHPPTRTVPKKSSVKYFCNCRIGEIPHMAGSMSFGLSDSMADKNTWPREQFYPLNSY